MKRLSPHLFSLRGNIGRFGLRQKCHLSENIHGNKNNKPINDLCRGRRRLDINSNSLPCIVCVFSLTHLFISIIRNLKACVYINSFALINCCRLEVMGLPSIMYIRISKINRDKLEANCSSLYMYYSIYVYLLYINEVNILELNSACWYSSSKKEHTIVLLYTM